MITINVWKQGQLKLTEMPAYQVEIEGLHIWKLASAIEKVADANEKIADAIAATTQGREV